MRRGRVQELRIQVRIGAFHSRAPHANAGKSVRPQSPGVYCRVQCCCRKILSRLELQHGDMGAWSKVRRRPGGLGAAFSLVSVIRHRPSAEWGAQLGCVGEEPAGDVGRLAGAALDGHACFRGTEWVLRNARRWIGSSRYGCGLARHRHRPRLLYCRLPPHCS
jgi:hypothetical protein